MKYILTLALLHSTFFISGQAVGISTDGAAPDPSAMLDIRSTDRGILIPRMTSAQRIDIDLPAVGLLVFDLDSETFWFREASGWTELVSVGGGPASDHITDVDGDTYIHTESTADNDRIVMEIGGDPVLTILENSSNAHRFETSAISRNLFFGHRAGESSLSGYNTFLGYEAGADNLGGADNVYIGYRAGMSNLQGDDNVMIGHRAGEDATSGSNVFIGRLSGASVTTGSGNVFLGYNSGDSNTTGLYNSFIGHNVAGSNTTGSRNTFMGQGAGFYNNEGDENTFVGVGSGRRNRTGTQNVGIGNNALGANLNSGDLGDGNTALGWRSGFYVNGGNANTTVGSSAGYGISTSSANTVMGYQAGYFINQGHSNTVLGHRALYGNIQGSNNVAIGDSAMVSTSGSGSVVIGKQAGWSGSGSDNVFVGRLAGALNSATADANVFVGVHSGTANTDGRYNTFVGGRSGRYNTSGESNTFIGLECGDRNNIGSQNTFSGMLAGHGNTIGNDNTTMGFRSLFGNAEGSGNVALGFEALANLANVNSDLIRAQNTAVGYQSGHIDFGDHNTTIGSMTSAGQGNYNIAIGSEASTAGIGDSNGANHSIAIGRQATTGGSESIAIGHNTVLGGSQNIIFGNEGVDGVNVNNAVGIGNDVTLIQDHSVIVGDNRNQLLTVGIGTNKPNAILHVNNTGTSWPRVFQVDQSGSTGLVVTSNLGVAIGDNLTPPAQGLEVVGNTELLSDLSVADDVSIGDQLYINTTIMPTDYRVAIDGKVACTEIRVQEVIDWPDYVFDKSYKLRSIQEMKAFIETNHHLPGVPSAAEVKENGIELGMTNKILLEKIEELSLYIIQLELRLQSLENLKD